MAMEMANIIGKGNFLNRLNTLIDEIQSLTKEMSLDPKKNYSFQVREQFVKLFSLSNTFSNEIHSNVISEFRKTFDILMKNIVSYEDLLQYINILYNILSEIKINKTKSFNEMCSNY